MRVCVCVGAHAQGSLCLLAPRALSHPSRLLLLLPPERNRDRDDRPRDFLFRPSLFAPPHHLQPVFSVRPR